MVDSNATTILSAYEVLRELKRGGLGIVYLARHRVLNDLRAIKRPQSRDGFEHQLLQSRFRREVTAVGAMHHDHVVRALDAGEDSEGPYLVMEYLDGYSLSELVEHHGKLGVAVACELVRQAALALQAAHERGLVHRDVKTSNLMLARANSGARVVVIDWGLVKLPSDDGANGRQTPALTSAGTTVGTPDYVSPEQIADSSEVDIRSDIYSLGVTFYCLLAGNPPFHDRNQVEKVRSHLGEAFPPPGRLRADIPPKVLAILDKMVEKDPSRRYAQPGIVAAQLQQWSCGAESHLLVRLLESSPGEQMIATFESANAFGRDAQLRSRTAKSMAPSTAVHDGGTGGTLRSASNKPCLPAAISRRIVDSWKPAALMALGLAALGLALGALNKEMQSPQVPTIVAELPPKLDEAAPPPPMPASQTAPGEETAAVTEKQFKPVILVAPFENQSAIRQTVSYEVGTGIIQSRPKQRVFTVDRFTAAPRSVLENKLHNVTGITIVERQKVDSLLVETEFGAMSGMVDQKKAVKLGKLLGANLIVMGTITSIRDETRKFKGYGIESESTNVVSDVIVRLLDIETSVELYSKKLKGSKKYTKTTYGSTDSSDRNFAAVEEALQQLDDDAQFKAALFRK